MYTCAGVSLFTDLPMLTGIVLRVSALNDRRGAELFAGEISPWNVTEEMYMDPCAIATLPNGSTKLPSGKSVLALLRKYRL